MILDLYYINLPQGCNSFTSFFSALFRETERSALFHVEQPQEKADTAARPAQGRMEVFHETLVGDAPGIRDGRADRILMVLPADTGRPLGGAHESHSTVQGVEEKQADIFDHKASAGGGRWGAAARGREPGSVHSVWDTVSPPSRTAWAARVCKAGSSGGAGPGRDRSVAPPSRRVSRTAVGSFSRRSLLATADWLFPMRRAASS